MQLGDLIEGGRRLGVTYDPKGDVIHVATDVLEHAIAAPQRVIVLEESDGLRAIEVIDAEGSKQLMRFSGLMMLPMPVGTEDGAG